MFPPIFAIAASSSDVTSLLGANPVRFYLFGEATQQTAKPYAVWQIVTGHPGNTLSCLPDHDYITTQVDVYGTSASSARNVARALRDAFEESGECYITAWRGESKEASTNLFRVGFDVEWIVDRA